LQGGCNTHNIPPIETILGNRDIATALANWYMLMYYNLDGYERGVLAWSRQEEADLAKNIKDRLLWYLVLACVGEARYANGMVRGSLVEIGPLAQAIIMSTGTIDRYSGWNRGYHLALHFGQLAVLQACVEIFNMEWPGATYGGGKWATIAQVGVDYLDPGSGPFYKNTNLLIDRMVDLVHNGGWAFDKWYYQTTIQTYHKRVRPDLEYDAELPGLDLKAVLDLKAQNPELLFGRVTTWPIVYEARKNFQRTVRWIELNRYYREEEARNR